MEKIWKKLAACVLALAILVGTAPMAPPVTAYGATYAVSLTSLGQKGTVTFGAKTKSGTWWQMHVNGKDAFCLNLGYTCHSGNTYASEQTYHWDQDTTGAEGLYAKIIRWFVLDKNRSNKAFVMSQALVWSVAEGRTSKEQLTDVISQVKSNTGIAPAKTADALYKDIFEPNGEWSSDLTFWQKTGYSTGYQRLLTVDAEDVVAPSFDPKKMRDSTYYRQRITVMKKDGGGEGLGGIQFTLKAHNLDDLYSVVMADRDGTEASEADEENDTSFTMTGHTKDSGRLAYRMTYKLVTMYYYYFPDDDLAAMSADEKRMAKEYLADTLELDEGTDFPSDLTKTSAQKMMEKEMKGLKDDISNTYTLTEDNTGTNTDLIMDPDFKKGVKITLKKADSWEKGDDGVWPDTKADKPSEYSKAYTVTVTNQHKKAAVKVVKKDSYSADGKAHGDASLDGAKFQLYADASCTTKATVYTEKGKAKEAGAYTVKDGQIETDYLKSGTAYYLKETKAPTGYTLASGVLKIKPDMSGKTAEYTKDAQALEFGNKPILGKVAIQKYYSDGQGGKLNFESGASFQAYLTSKGSFDACDKYERAEIRTDENGYGVTGDLYYGKYTVHQVDSGGVDAALVADFQVEVTEDGKTYTFPLDNRLFGAYLRVLKKDGNTENQVLKAGTAYQIYKVNGDKEELVEQTYSDGNQTRTISRFVANETGEIMTVKKLTSGTYRIYETDSATGLHITQDFIEVTINSKAGNYETFTDADGNSHAVITLTYTNQETYGKLKLYKTGEMLTGYQDGKFVYEERLLKGAAFEIRASEDIVSQDGQGTVLYAKGSLVATARTGTDAHFTKEYKGLTGYELQEDGILSMSLPLGKYHVEETQAPYGYVLPDEGWDVEFTWKNKDEEFVLNATGATDKDGVLRVSDARARAAIALEKADAETKKAVAGAVYGLYSKSDIYNVDGQKIVAAGTLLEKVTTDAEGKAESMLDLPLKGEAYSGGATAATSMGAAAVSGSAGTAASGGNVAAASGSAVPGGNVSATSGTATPGSAATSGTAASGTSAPSGAAASPVASVLSAAGRLFGLSAGETAQGTAAGTPGATAVSGSTASTASGSSVPAASGAATVSGAVPPNTTTVSGAAASRITAASGASIGSAVVMNTGDYYFKELSVSESYYLNETEYPVHLEYKDQATRTVTASALAEDTQTKAVISKRSLTGSGELAGCRLEITDGDGNFIISWTSGEPDSVAWREGLEEKGYENLAVDFDKKGNLVIGGLFRDTTYILMEKQPADGYVTAEKVSFQLVEGENSQTLAALFDGDDLDLQKDNIVRMYDDTTKIQVSKTEIAGSEEIIGCRLEITDKETGKAIDQWTSEKAKHYIEGKLVVGKTYILTEKRPADGYATADSVEFKVADTGKIQGVHMEDGTTKIRLVKLAQDTGAGLSGARFEVLDSSGTKVLEFTSNKDGFDITGKLAVGQPYTFRETEAPRGYKLADPVIYTVLDTPDLQTISVTDEKNPNPNVPQTGGVTPFLVAAFVLAAFLVAGILTWHRRRKKRLK